MNETQVCQIIKGGGDWALYNVPFIVENQDSFIYDLNISHANFKDVFENADSSLTRRDHLTLGDVPRFFNHVENAGNSIANCLNSSNITHSGYSFYNIFSLTSPSPYFYELYSIFRNIVRMHLGARPIWFQCWMNFHSSDNVLGWHNHAFPYHGYISIDPHKTTTLFKEHDDPTTVEDAPIFYEIENNPGQIYFGPGWRPHKVRVDEKFDRPRLTLGFDISFQADIPDSQFSLHPLL
jgi:hypothetical protein